eukprot:TRINITY_DN12453_c0_g1_i1.p1 TRINITY_DN12453_c0_g1~~TRINITY_DN12453_c0_g1_i1.p1  ORF type:complete len:1522 (-),score=269.94 TRINITY_DN12453_c0_g1_i1:145-4710(-)
MRWMDGFSPLSGHDPEGTVAFLQEYRGSSFLDAIPEDENVGDVDIQKVEWMELARCCIISLEGIVILVIMLVRNNLMFDGPSIYFVLLQDALTIMANLFLMEFFYYELYPIPFRCLRRCSCKASSYTNSIDVASYCFFGLFFTLGYILPGELPMTCLLVVEADFLPLWVRWVFSFCLGSLLAYQCRQCEEPFHHMLCSAMLGGFTLYSSCEIVKSTDAHGNESTEFDSTTPWRDFNAIVHASFKRGPQIILGLIEVDGDDETVPDRLLKVSDRFGDGFKVLPPDQYSLQSLTVDGTRVWPKDNSCCAGVAGGSARRLTPWAFANKEASGVKLDEDFPGQDTMKYLYIRLSYSTSQTLWCAMISHWAVRMLLSALAVVLLVLPFFIAFQTFQDLHEEMCAGIRKGILPAPFPDSDGAKVCKDQAACEHLCGDLISFISITFENLGICWSELLVPLPLVVVVILVAALFVVESDHEALMARYFGCLPLAKGEVGLLRFYQGAIRDMASWRKVYDMISTTTSAWPLSQLRPEDISDDLVFKDKANGVFVSIMSALCSAAKLSQGMFVTEESDAGYEFGELKKTMNLFGKTLVKATIDVPIYFNDDSTKEPKKKPDWEKLFKTGRDHVEKYLWSPANEGEQRTSYEKKWKLCHVILCHDDDPNPVSDQIPVTGVSGDDQTKGREFEPDSMIFRFSTKGDVEVSELEKYHISPLIADPPKQLEFPTELSDEGFECGEGYYLSVYRDDPDAWPRLTAMWIAVRRISVLITSLIIAFGVPFWREYVEHGTKFPKPFDFALVHSSVVQFLVLWLFFDSFVTSSLKLDFLGQALSMLETKTMAPSAKTKKKNQKCSPFDMYVEDTDDAKDHGTAYYKDQFKQKGDNVQWWHQTANHFRAFLSGTRLTSQVILVAAAFILVTALAASIVQAATGKGAFSVDSEKMLSMVKDAGSQVARGIADQASTAIHQVKSQVQGQASDLLHSVKSQVQDQASDLLHQAKSQVRDQVSDLLPGSRRLIPIGTASARLDAALQPTMVALRSAAGSLDRRLSALDKALEVVDLKHLDIGKITKLQLLTIVILVALVWYSVPMIIQIARINSLFDRHEHIMVAQKTKHQETQKVRDDLKKKREDCDDHADSDNAERANAKASYEAMKQIQTAERANAKASYEAMKQIQTSYEATLHMAAESAKQNRIRYALTLFGFVINFGLLATWILLAFGPVLEQGKKMAPQLAYAGCLKIESAVGKVNEEVQEGYSAVTSAVSGVANQVADAANNGISAASSVVNGVANQVVDAANNGISAASSAVTGAANQVLDAANDASSNASGETLVSSAQRKGLQNALRAVKPPKITTEGMQNALGAFKPPKITTEGLQDAMRSFKPPNLKKLFHGAVCVPLQKWVKEQAKKALADLEKEAKENQDADEEIENVESRRLYESRRLSTDTLVKIPHLVSTVKRWWDAETTLPQDIKLVMMHTKLQGIWAEAKRIVMQRAGDEPTSLSEFPHDIVFDRSESCTWTIHEGIEDFKDQR